VGSGRNKDKERIPRCFSRGETLRRGYCYKMSVWTDFGRVRVRTEIRYRTVVILLVYNGRRICDLKVM